MPKITINVLDAHSEQSTRAIGLLVPQAITTGHQTFAGLKIEGIGPSQCITEKTSGQKAVFLTDLPTNLVLNYAFEGTGRQDRPDDYAHFKNRYTRASLQLRDEIDDLIDDDSLRTAQRIVSHTASLFDYGHPDEKFYDGHDDVPVVACGTAKGSCVDINTYLISALGVAGIPTVYFAGYFFPQERDGLTNDMHCWVATWINGAWLEWDIAHHMKMGMSADDIRPAYNPKPGRRIAMTYGRGLTFDINTTELILSHLSEPRWVFADGDTQTARIEARLIG